MGTVAFWTQPIGTAIDSMRATSRTAIETGDPTFACYGMFQTVTGLLLRNEPLDTVWRESERALDFAREVKYGDSVDIIRSQQRFIATMRGRTAIFSTFSNVQFDEATFEAQLTGDRMTLMIAWYWILKLKARFPVRRLRRGSRSRREGEAAPASRRRSDPATRLLLLHCADGSGML
jgi:hypothetical protein